jgi:hypothetical protein
MEEEFFKENNIVEITGWQAAGRQILFEAVRCALYVCQLKQAKVASY